MNLSPMGGIQNGFEQLALNERNALGILQHLKKDELQGLLEDDQKLEQLIQDLEVMKEVKQVKQMLSISNKSVAEYNLSQEPKLIQNRNLLAETYGQIEGLQERVRKNKVQLGSCVNATSLDTLLALLETEAAKTEEFSEELSEQLLSKNLDVGKFVDSYLTARTRMYEQKVKADKLFEIMYQQT